MKKLLASICLLAAFCAHSQVKIGNNPGTIDANSLLEMESTNKGFLPPRVTLTSISSVSPLTGTVPAGMLVYNAAGSLPFGYYYWNSTEWKKLDNGNKDLVTKTADATVLKSESYVVGSNDITLTLPAVTAADNGLQISIKNIGTHTDLLTVVGSGGATIDGVTAVELSKNNGLSFIVIGSNWIINGGRIPGIHLMDVDAQGSWTSIQEAIEFLDIHMSGPTVIRLSDESYEIDNTIIINLPYALTIQGLSYGTSNIEAATGLTGKPMFRCFSDVYFKMLNFDATTLTNYGNLAGEDAIRLLGSGTYNEVKDSYFDGFNTTILDSTDAELWVFEVDIANAKSNGILVHSAVANTILKVAETDFINCKRGVNLSKADSATIQLASGVYYVGNGTDTAIVYRPATFTNFSSISVTGNSWNNVGIYISGFDFTRSDGRDANAKVEANAGTGDKKPYCFVNKVNATTDVAVSANVWTKVNWGANSSEVISKWTIAGNRITYQPTNKRNAIVTFTANIKTVSNNRNISICVVKNGESTNAAYRFGETTVRTSVANQPYQFSFLAFLEDINKNDYFEIFYMCTTGETLTIEDMQWLVTAQ